MDARDIAQLRLRNQRLVGARAVRPEAVVGWFGAMQAQEFAVAKWSIGQRSSGLDDTAVQRAFDDGLILRTHALRPTWHFVAAADLGWIQQLTGPRVRGTNQYYDRQHGIDETVVSRSVDVMTTALGAGNYRTRAELGARLEAAGLPGTGGALAYLVMRAELDGIVASGPMRGKQHTYALVAELAPQQTQLHGDEALAELTRRYFASHGPATVKDFAWWSSLTTVRIRHGIALLGDELTSIDVDGLRHWYAPSSIVDGDGPPAQVLQAYDEYVIGYKDSRAVANIAGLPYTFGEDRTSVHGFILDGQMIAMWRRFVAKGVISAQVKPLRPLTAQERRHIDAAFARYARFSGATVDVHIAH